MDFNIEVNNIPIKARKGETILQALQRNGIQVPTLCYMAGQLPTGACRMCVVEVEGYPGLIPSCSHPVEDWMKIKTHSPRVIQARKSVVELLLASHPDDCLYCVRNGNCELQRYAEELNVRERKYPSKAHPATIDKSSYSIVRDPAKCILCGRCIRVCEEIQSVSTFDYVNRGNMMYIGTTLDKPMNMSNCIDCGLCAISCPTSALYEKDNTDIVHKALYNKDVKVVALIDHTTGVSVAEEFGAKAGKDMTHIVVAALRKIGVDIIYNYNLGGDIYAQEMAKQLRNKVEGTTLISTSCPGWVKFVEEFMPQKIGLLASVKSPMEILGAAIKIEDNNLFLVAMTPCMAKKAELARPCNAIKGRQVINAALTTRELVRFIRLHGIDIDQLEPELTNDPYATATGAGMLMGYAGGESEAIIRALNTLVEPRKTHDNRKISKLRGVKPVKEYSISLGGKKWNFVAISGLANARKYMENFDSLKVKPDYIEVMACPGGCVNGGGQPIHKDNDKFIRARLKSIIELDEKSSLKSPLRNPAVKKWEQSRLEDEYLTPVFICREVLL